MMFYNFICDRCEKSENKTHWKTPNGWISWVAKEPEQNFILCMDCNRQFLNFIEDPGQQERMDAVARKNFEVIKELREKLEKANAEILVL